MTPKRILVLGLPFFGSKVTASLRGAGYDARYSAHPNRSPLAWARAIAEIARADAVYTIGSSIHTNSPLDLMVRAGKRALVHWVGSDVSYARRDWRAGRASRRVIRRALHRADAPWLVEELAPLGIRAAVRPLPVEVAIGNPVDLPQEFRVLVYLREHPTPAYDIEATLQVIRSLPGVRFTIVGGYRPAESLPNADAIGFVDDMAAEFRASTVLLRLMKHDGMAHSVIEAASFGRYVVWTYPLPGVIRVDDAEQAITAINDLQNRFSNEQLPLNLEGAQYMRQTYDYDRLVAGICEDLERLLA